MSTNINLNQKGQFSKKLFKKIQNELALNS
jgi:hypothetical protein